MSFTYYLDLGPGIPPERLKQLVSRSTKHAAGAPMLTITMAALESDDSDLSFSQYGFRPVWRIALRQSSIPTTEDVDHHLFSVIQDLLTRLTVDAALETQDPATVLVRRCGKMVLNLQCDAARWAAPFFPQAHWADLPAL